MNNTIGREEVLLPEFYEKKRQEETRKIISLKNIRRVSTKTFSFLFECRETVLNQINEMIFIESIHDDPEIEHLIRVYSDLLPSKQVLSVSMFIEISDERALMRELPRLAGIEKTVYLTFDGSELQATPEEGRSTDVLESTLQYLKFMFTPEQAAKFRDSSYVYIETRKEGYKESARIDGVLLDSLKKEI